MLLLLLPRRKFPVLLRYAASAVIVGAAALVRAAVQVPMQQSPLLLFVPAVFLCSLLFNHGSGFFATLVSAGIAAYFFMGPAGSFAFGVPGIIFILVFIVIGFTIAAVTEALRRTVHRVEDAQQHQSLLMREMAHRVKNDLALISSAISLQARTSKNEEVTRALEAANARVHVIAAAQALLRPGSSGGEVSLPDYIQNLCDGLGEVLRGIRPIAIRVHCARVVVQGTVAASVGLIVNELVTNSLKYAFPEDKGGIINVNIDRADDGLTVTVTDNGVGCSETAAGLGSRLVRLLAKQRGGAFTRVSRDGGCEATASLPDLR